MEKEIQKRVRGWVGIGFLVFLVFWSYDATNYLRISYEVNPVPYDKFDVVVLGDSITEGLGATYGKDYVSLLRDHTNVKIRNIGIRDDQTKDGLDRIYKDVVDYDPDIAILFLGGNDYIRFIPEEEVFGNIEKMIDILQEEGIQVLMLGVPGGVFEDSYRADFDRIAEEKDVHYLPNVLEGIIGKAKFMRDPLHPNDLGHQMLFERIYPELDRLLEIYY